MISRINYYIARGTDPYENLAVEKYLTMHTEPGQCILYLWQNEKTVVIGKNQNAWKECKNELLEEDGGHLARRLSGGGAVFHDLGNLNFTFCVRRPDYHVDRQLSVIVEAVRRLGIQAEISGRNDVTVDGRKISGNAFYRRGDFCYHHGTILISVDKQQMSKYLRVSEQKLRSKGVDSVKVRVANLCECTSSPVTVESVKAAMLVAFESCYGLSAQPFKLPVEAGASVAADTRFFDSWEWKYGQKIPFTHEMSQRFDWGDVDLQLFVDGGIVQAAVIYSDAMEQELIETLKNSLPGIPYDYRKMTELVHKCVEAYTNMDGLERVAAAKRIENDICRLLRDRMVTAGSTEDEA